MTEYTYIHTHINEMAFVLPEVALGLAEALNFTDIAADISEMGVEGFLSPFEGASLERGVQGILDKPLTSAAGVAGIAGTFGLKPAIQMLAHHEKKAGVPKHRQTDPNHKRFMPVRRSFSLYRNAPNLARTMVLGKRSRSSAMFYKPSSYGRYKRSSKRRKTSGGLKYKTYTKDYNATGSTTAKSGIAVVKKLALCPNPTTQEAGGSLNFQITNSQLKTTPDGQGSFAWNFNLSQFPQYTEYTALYQWYKILGVRVTFYPEQNSMEASNAAFGAVTYNGSGAKVSSAPLIVVSPDQTSDALFGGIGPAMAHHSSTFHSFNGGKEFSVYLSPKPNSLVGQSGGEVQTLSSTNKWITTTSANVEHYGLRCFVDRFSDASSLYCVMEMKVAFKEPKT